MYALLMPDGSSKKEENNLANLIYENIKDKIIDGKLPPSSLLPERGFAKEFGVSRTPVREALKRLSQEGWINWEERRRAVVSEIKEKDVVELFVMREMIEPFAFRRIIAFGEPALLAGMLVTIAKEMEELKDDHVELMKKDMVFHSTIVNFVGVEKLSMMWQRISDEMTRLAIYALHARRRPEDILAEHRMIIDAFWNSDLERALACIHDHHAKIQTAYKVKQHLDRGETP